MTQTSLLLSPFQLGPTKLANRMVMAPMTRSRAAAGNVAADLAIEYYSQRAGAGLIVTEGTQVSPRGVGYLGTPGIYSEAQTAGWRKITEAVHERGGKIFAQLWHVGRVSHPSFQPNGGLPVAPSAITPAGHSRTMTGTQPHVEPRALESAEIAEVVAEFATGARSALHAGFDGVEIHAANGYLIDQFLRDGTNVRTDEYGGSAENRVRFLVEIVTAVAEVWGGAERVGVRLSPLSAFNDISDSDPFATFGAAASALDGFGLAYLHLVVPGSFNPESEEARITAHLRERFHGPLMVNGGYTFDAAEEVVASGRADLVSFGSSFLANPDLPERFAEAAPLNAPNPATFYGGGAEGYTDYPALGATVSA
ncbi:MAG: alkene reductase [Acidobacteriota bacterium]